MSGQKPKNQKRTPHRGQDRERKARDVSQSLPRGLWADVREQYPPETRAIVDGLVTRGASVMDVVSLAVAAYDVTRRRVAELWAERLAARAADAEGADRDHEAPGVRSVQMLDQVAARYLSIAQAGVRDLNAPVEAGGTPVEVPTGLTRAELLARPRREHEIIN